MRLSVWFLDSAFIPLASSILFAPRWVPVFHGLHPTALANTVGRKNLFPKSSSKNPGELSFVGLHSLLRLDLIAVVVHWVRRGNCALPSWLLLLLHPVLSNHSQKAGGARTGGARPQCTEVTPAGDMTLTRAEKPSRTPQAPVPRHSEPLGLAYILCLGTGLLLPGLSFPVCTTMGVQADVVSPFQAGEDAGPWPLTDTLRLTRPQPRPSPPAGL